MTITEDSTATDTTTSQFRVTTDQGALTTALKAAVLAVPKRPQVPILACIKLSGSEAGVTAVAFDFEVAVRHDFAGFGQGEVLVNGRDLLNLVKDLAKGCVVDLYQDGTTLYVEGDDVQYQLLTAPLEEYPNLPTVKGQVRAALDPATMASLTDVATCAGGDPTMPALFGILLRLGQGTLTAAATDKYRLAIYEATGTEFAGDDANLLIPRGGVDLLPKLFKGSEVRIRHTKRPLAHKNEPDSYFVEFSSGATTLTVLTTLAEYPKVRALMPDRDSFTTSVTIKSADLAKGIKQVAKVAQRNTPVHFTTEADTLVLTGGAGEDMKARKALTAQVSGEGLTTAYNPGFTLDVIDLIGEDTVQLEATSNTKPAVLSSPTRPQMRVLLMPVRITA